MKDTFLYIWRDSKNKKYYVGMHKHIDGDDYAHSSSKMESFKLSTKPRYMKRKILVWDSYEKIRKLEGNILEKKALLEIYYNVPHPKTLDPVRAGKAGGLSNRGILKSIEHRKKISESNTGQSSHWLKGDSEKKRENLSKTMSGNTNSKNHNTKEYSNKHSEVMKKAWERRRNKKKQSVSENK